MKIEKEKIVYYFFTHSIIPWIIYDQSYSNNGILGILSVLVDGGKN